MTTSALPSRTVALRPLRRLYLVRAGLAVVWAVAFAAVSSHLSAGAMTLLVVYPLIDVLASVVDARTDPRGGRIPWLNAGVSTAAVVALVVATGRDTTSVLVVFGAWAAVSGLIQLVVAVRRRARYGRQWAMLVSGGLSTLAGIAFTTMAMTDDPTLTSLAGYAGLGGVLFAVSALLLRTRA